MNWLIGTHIAHHIVVIQKTHTPTSIPTIPPTPSSAPRLSRLRLHAPPPPPTALRPAPNTRSHPPARTHARTLACPSLTGSSVMSACRRSPRAERSMHCGAETCREARRRRGGEGRRKEAREGASAWRGEGRMGGGGREHTDDEGKTEGEKSTSTEILSRRDRRRRRHGGFRRRVSGKPTVAQIRSHLRHRRVTPHPLQCTR